MPRLPKQNESNTPVADEPAETIAKHVAEITGEASLELTQAGMSKVSTTEATTPVASEVVTPSAAANDSALVEVPLPEVERQSWGLHLNAQLSPDQSHALRRLTVGLDRSLATLANGQRVVNATGAVKYLLELLAQAK